MIPDADPIDALARVVHDGETARVEMASEEHGCVVIAAGLDVDAAVALSTQIREMVRAEILLAACAARNIEFDRVQQTAALYLRAQADFFRQHAGAIFAPRLVDAIHKFLNALADEFLGDALLPRLGDLR